MRFITVATALLILAPAPSAGAELVPDWRLATADGGSVRLSQEVKEQPVILFFWATWCPYCKALMPHLQSIKLELGDDIEILTNIPWDIEFFSKTYRHLLELVDVIMTVRHGSLFDVWHVII